MTTADPTAIADRVATMHEGMADRLPDEVLGAFGAEQAKLDARGIPADIAEPGDTLRPSRCARHENHTVECAGRTHRDRRAVSRCPYCNLALRAYQEDLVPALADGRVALVAISPQKPDGSLSAREKNELTFSVLSDPGNTIADRLGVMTVPSETAQAAQRAIGLDLPEANADGSSAQPMPTVVIVDPAGVIRWIDVHPNYTTRTGVSDILAALDTIS